MTSKEEIQNAIAELNTMVDQKDWINATIQSRIVYNLIAVQSVEREGK